MIVLSFAGIAGIFYSAIYVVKEATQQVSRDGVMTISWRDFGASLTILMLSIVCLVCSLFSSYILGGINREGRVGSIGMINSQEIRRVEMCSPTGDGMWNLITRDAGRKGSAFWTKASNPLPLGALVKKADVGKPGHPDYQFVIIETKKRPLDPNEPNKPSELSR